MAFKMKPSSPLLKSTMLYSDGGTNENPKTEKKNLNKYNVIDDIASPNKQVNAEVAKGLAKAAAKVVVGGSAFPLIKKVGNIIGSKGAAKQLLGVKGVSGAIKQPVPEGKKVNIKGELYDVKSPGSPMKQTETADELANNVPESESAGEKLKNEVKANKSKLKEAKNQLKEQKKITKLEEKAAKIDKRTKKKEQIKKNLEAGLTRKGKEKPKKYDKETGEGGTKVGNALRQTKKVIKNAIKDNIKLKKGSNDGEGTKAGNLLREGKKVVKKVVNKIIPKRKERTGEGYKQTDYICSKRIGEQRQSPNKQIGVNKKDTKAFEKTKKLEARADRKLERLDAKKQRIVNRTNKKAERKAKRILSSPAKSFKGLVSKLERQGKSKEAATKIAGKVANAKLKGAGSGPTAKQKARMKK